MLRRVALLALLVLAATAESCEPPPPHWTPTTGTTWQWQIDGLAVDPSVDAEVYDVDYDSTTSADVANLHALGRKVICYFSAGGWEEWRTDADQFPAAVLGENVGGWPGERWLDIRALDVLLPIMAARMDVCAAKGFDGVEGDLMDGWDNNTGFPLTATDQVAFNSAFADLAHAKGLAVGLKNAAELVPDLVEVMDYVVVEECVEWSECDAYLPFADAGKPVFHAEYQGTMTAICAGRPATFSTIKKNLDLNAYPYQRCP